MRKLVAVVLFVAVAACGGSEASSGEKKAYISQADKLCEAAQKQLDDLALNPSDPVAAFGKVAPVLEGLAASLSKLTPPPGEESRVSALISIIEDLADRLRDAAEARNSGDEAKAQSIALDLQTSGADQAKQFKDYGFNVCGQTGNR